MPDDNTDLIVPIDRWEELLRIVAVMGYPPHDHVPVAVLLAALEDNVEAAFNDLLRLDFDHPEVTPGGVIIHRRAKGAD